MQQITQHPRLTLLFFTLHRTKAQQQNKWKQIALRFVYINLTNVHNVVSNLFTFLGWKMSDIILNGG